MSGGLKCKTSGVLRGLLLEAGLNFGPRRIKKSFSPAPCAELIQMIAVFGLETLKTSRRHQFHTQTLRNRFCFSDFCVPRRHDCQKNTFALAEILHEVHCGGGISVNGALIDPLVIGNR